MEQEADGAAFGAVNTIMSLFIPCQNKNVPEIIDYLKGSVLPMLNFVPSGVLKAQLEGLADKKNDEFSAFARENIIPHASEVLRELASTPTDEICANLSQQIIDLKPSDFINFDIGHDVPVDVQDAVDNWEEDDWDSEPSDEDDWDTDPDYHNHHEPVFCDEPYDGSEIVGEITSEQQEEIETLETPYCAEDSEEEF